MIVLIRVSLQAGWFWPLLCCSLLFEECVSPVLLLEGEPREFMISGKDETVLVYVYESPAAAAKQQGLVSSDGFRIIIKQNENESSEIIYEWISAPHW